MRSESKETLDIAEEKVDFKSYSKELKEDKESGESLVNKVINYFFDNDEFAGTFEKFAERHCHIFDVDSEEMKLEYDFILLMSK
jgi:hypothetical protein